MVRVSRKKPPTSIAPFAGACLLAAVVVLAAACAVRAPLTATGDGRGRTLRLLGSVAYPAGGLTVPGGPSVGSLSGLAFDRQTGQWVAASDETVQARLAWLDIEFGPTLTVRPLRFTFLGPGPGLPADAVAGLEPESLVVMPDGSFVTSIEGYHDTKDMVHQPALAFVARDGGVTQLVRPRAHFAIVPGDRTRGVRHNLGLESLTRTPDGRLLSGLEQPLAQDGPMSSVARGGIVRLLEFVERPGRGWTPGREWAYPLEATAIVPGYDRPCEDGQNGLSDLLALDNDRWLALERACLLGRPGAPAYNPVRVFEVNTEGADDVSGLPSLAGHQIRLLSKRSVLDVTAVLPRLARAAPVFAPGSNFEALAFGPAGPRGERTVVLMSDDNLRATQTTVFLWLALP